MIVAAAILIAFLCAIASVAKIAVLPPKVEARDFQSAGAVARVMVDLGRSGITDRRAEWSYFNRVDTRADVLAHLMASDPVLEYIGRRAHVPPDQIAAVAPVGIEVAGPLTEPGSEARAREILLASKPYRLEIQSRPGSPIVDVYAQAPSLGDATRLADASIAGARDFFRAVATGTGRRARARTGGDGTTPVRLRQLGRPRGAALTAGARLKVAVLTFVLAFAVAWAALRFAVSRRSFVPGRDGRGALGRRPARPALSSRGVVTADGDWPRTTRALPWMLAAFIAMLWLVPFDSLQLDIPSPIDLKLDRIVLPCIVATWAMTLAIGGRGAPRVRPTWIHGAVGAFVVVACLSVILNAPSLNGTLELETSLKKLPLLLSYLSIFVMTASVIRRDEVAAFIRYTLVLAVLCALGMIWEDHRLHNVFFEWSQHLLPSVFQLTTTSSGWDTEGRRLVHGPTAHPLVAASMLSLAVPIALLGVLHARRVSGRIAYGLAGCLLMLGVLGTQRKTGLVAPVAGVLTVAYFRRRELLRLTPVAVVLLIGLVVASPSTVAPVIDQFRPDSLSEANTVSDRASDYDAIRPDFGTHVAFGRGYGSYQPIGHRILDSEVLVRIVEMGVLGLVALVLLGASVVACARRMIHSRHPSWAPPALAGAAAGVVFLVVALLFDSLAYPQLPYIFLYFAALVAVLVKSPDDDDASSPGGGYAGTARRRIRAAAAAPSTTQPHQPANVASAPPAIISRG